jgi:WD40 repeat protein
LVAFGGSGAACRALLASRERDGYMRLWDLDGARAPVAKMPGSSHKQTPVACGTGAGDRALLAEGDFDGTVRLWCPTDTRPGERLTLHSGPVTSVVFGSGAGVQALLATGAALMALCGCETPTCAHRWGSR